MQDRFLFVKRYKIYLSRKFSICSKVCLILLLGINISRAYIEPITHCSFIGVRSIQSVIIAFKMQDHIWKCGELQCNVTGGKIKNKWITRMNNEWIQIFQLKVVSSTKNHINNILLILFVSEHFDAKLLLTDQQSFVYN